MSELVPRLFFNSGWYVIPSMSLIWGAWLFDNSSNQVASWFFDTSLSAPSKRDDRKSEGKWVFNSIDYTEICLAAQVARVQVSSPFILFLRSPSNWNQQFDWYERQSGFHPDTMKKNHGIFWPVFMASMECLGPTRPLPARRLNITYWPSGAQWFQVRLEGEHSMEPRKSWTSWIWVLLEWNLCVSHQFW